MFSQCIFCSNPANSKEDVWSEWILEDLKPGQPVRIKVGKTFSKWINNPEVRIGCVCRTCNNGWMSNIESENKPHMLAMINGKPTLLMPTEQKLLARWAILKAMVIDGSSKKRTPFYSESERIDMKGPSRFLPVCSLVWIGSLSVKAFHAGLTDIFTERRGFSKALHGCVTTIIVGHLVIQVVTLHAPPLLAAMRVRPNCRSGAWDANLLEIWPAFWEKQWPPESTFTLDGTVHQIGQLVNRFKIGKDVG